MGLGQPSVFSSCILDEMVMSTFALLRGDAAFPGPQFGAGMGVMGSRVTAVGTWPDGLSWPLSGFTVLRARGRK